MSEQQAIEHALNDPMAFIRQCDLNPTSLLNPASAETIELIEREQKRMAERFGRLELAKQNLRERLNH